MAFSCNTYTNNLCFSIIYFKKSFFSFYNILIKSTFHIPSIMCAAVRVSIAVPSLAQGEANTGFDGVL